MLRQRVVTALWLTPLSLAAAWLGPPWFTLLIALGALGAAREFYRLAGLPGYLQGLGVLFSLLFVLSPHIAEPQVQPALITAAVLLSLLVSMRLSPSGQGIACWAVTLTGIFYVGWLLSLWVSLWGEGGREWVLFALLVTFASDTAAYFVGRGWGRHPLAPGLSPGKTWEGAVGGLVAAGGVALLLSPFLPLPWAWALGLGLLAGAAGQSGDLAESFIKRSAGVKDAGAALAGHGGVLDRIDSIVFTGAVVYYFVVWLR